jgi:hypothetical protein
MQIQKRTMNWLPRPSAYDEMVSRRAKRKAEAEEFIDRQSTLAGVFSGAQTDAVTQMGDLVSQIAQARLSKTA